MRTFLFIAAALATPAGAIEIKEMTYSYKSSTQPLNNSASVVMINQQLDTLGCALKNLHDCQKTIAKDDITSSISCHNDHILQSPLLVKYIELLGHKLGVKFNTDYLENSEYYLIKTHIQHLTVNLTLMKETLNFYQRWAPCTDIYLIDSGPITLEEFIKCCQ